MTKPKKKWSANKIVKRKLAELKPYKHNSKIHPPSQISQIAKSIEEWGFTIPLLIDEKNNVISGHGRLVAAIDLEMKSVPCIVAEGWTTAQRRAYVIADNKLAEQSIWDEDLLYIEMNALMEVDFDIDLTGLEIKDELSFETNIHPTIGNQSITDKNMAGAADKISGQMANIVAEKSTGTEIMCPYCEAIFKVQGG
ncbi:MAG: chromosome partitioning protein ParB [Parcubacteria group bacterium]|nr:chromosome partitioning protein ParB [Parcubacteria group bacterium]|tara:strand:- start:4738 stop:5325 length:588 start_codon:yes stop_codon:yes gene_type:complete